MYLGVGRGCSEELPVQKLSGAAQQHKEIFETCHALWSQYRHVDGRTLRVFGRMTNGSPEVLPVDYVCDFESTIKRTVGAQRYAEVMRLCQIDPELIGEPLQAALGEAFMDANLDSDYAVLFFRAKQSIETAQRDPEPASVELPDGADLEALSPEPLDVEGLFEDTDTSLNYFGEAQL